MQRFICLVFFILFISSCSKSQDVTGTVNPPENPDTPDTTSSSFKRPSISWKQSTLTKISSKTSYAGYSGYARMIKLDDGSLMCVYEADGNTVTVKSDDDGISWKNLKTIAKSKNGTSMSAPDLLQLDGGTILIAYNPRPLKPYNDSKHFAIRTVRSTNNGKTWEQDTLVYQADSVPANGCWEPALIQLPSGKVQLYFSNEGIYTNSNDQNISFFESDDGGSSWSSHPQIASYRNGSRDGMPTPIYLKDNHEIVLSIEDPGFQNFKPYTVRTPLDDDWSIVIRGQSSSRAYALSKKLKVSTYAGAPFLVKLPGGATLLSYQGTEGRINDLGHSEMKVAVGNKKARNFKKISPPFDIPANKSGLWNSLAVLNDSTVAALTSTNAYSSNNKTEVWMIKGYLIKK